MGMKPSNDNGLVYISKHHDIFMGFVVENGNTPEVAMFFESQIEFFNDSIKNMDNNERNDILVSMKNTIEEMGFNCSDIEEMNQTQWAQKAFGINIEDTAEWGEDNIDPQEQQ